MPWIRIEDHFDEHPKFQELGAGAMALWFRCLAYCNRNLTDGFIPNSVADEKAWRFNKIEPEVLVAELVNAGLWEEERGGYRMHDFLDYQPSQAESLAKRESIREVRSQAGRKGADSKWHGKRDSKRDGKPPESGSQTDGPVPVPVPVPVVPVPVPDPEDERPVPATRSRFAPPTLEMVAAYCLERGNNIDPQTWIDHYSSNGWRVGRNPMKDWRAAVRTWEKNGLRSSSEKLGSSKGKGATLMELGRRMKEGERSE